VAADSHRHFSEMPRRTMSRTAVRRKSWKIVPTYLCCLYFQVREHSGQRPWVSRATASLQSGHTMRPAPAVIQARWHVTRKSSIGLPSLRVRTKSPGWPRRQAESSMKTLSVMTTNRPSLFFESSDRSLPGGMARLGCSDFGPGFSWKKPLQLSHLRLHAASGPFSNRVARA